MVNLLQINSVCGIGSTGRIATDIHALAVSRGHCSTVAFGRGPAKNCDRILPIGSRSDVLAHGLWTRLFDAHGFGSRKATRNFLAAVDDLNPDIIHLHNIHGYYLHVGLLFDYLKRAGKPVVWTLHDCWPFTGHCAYFDFIGCERWKTECHHCPLKSEYPASLLLDCSRNNYRRKRHLFKGVENLILVTPSLWLADLVKASFLGDYPVTTINNGIDLNTFRALPGRFRQDRGLDGKFIILGVASNWAARKGYSHFLELSKNLKSDERIIMVGVTQEQQSKLPTNILGITRTNNAVELAEIYANSDVFVNPTLEDNFPTTNLEALACGTPVITYASGGSPECLDERTGFVVARGDLTALGATIALVRARGKAAYSEDCRQRAEGKFDRNNRFEDYLDLYQQRLGGPAAGL